MKRAAALLLAALVTVGVCIEPKPEPYKRCVFSPLTVCPDESAGDGDG
jgi:hypothetical protein